MFLIVGLVIVFGSVIGGYMMHHGNLAILLQVNELLIIGGAGVGSFVVANPTHVLKKAVSSLKLFFGPSHPYSKSNYTELLLFQYTIFKFMKTKGMLAIESHIEDPASSDLFAAYPNILANHHAITFFTDYVRLLTMGIDDHFQIGDMMESELELHHHSNEEVASSIVTLGDAFPALGIVAAVLGVITTMGSITEPPEILGGLIGAALVGTFLGVLLSYGMVGPIGHYLNKYFNEESKYYECIKTGLLAHIQGNAPTVSIEFARKAIPDDVRPSFKEIEEAMNAL